LDNADVDWIPPLDFLKWIEKARLDGKPIVYIGFGSITMPKPNRVLAQIVEAVTQSQPLPSVESHIP
jgi:sterol 3beta-glucosyltransferase